MPRASKVFSRFPRAGVQVRLNCGNPELVSVLHSLESGSPRLFVDNLNILPLRYGTPGGSGGGLDVSFDLYGFLEPALEAGDADR